ncbi:hypothetical protein SRHO_G00115500 [Serrasalmus rhombeus]
MIFSAHRRIHLVRKDAEPNQEVEDVMMEVSQITEVLLGLLHNCSAASGPREVRLNGGAQEFENMGSGLSTAEDLELVEVSRHNPNPNGRSEQERRLHKQL